MTKMIRRIGIFLSSPGDLINEREAISQVCQEITLDHGRHQSYVIELIRWETHAWSARGMDGQDVLNGQLGLDFEIYLGMFWSKFGTPTPRWRSGTEEEFRIAQTLNSQTGKPELMFFFSATPIAPASIRPEQIGLINEFREEIQASGVLHFSFINSTDLKVLARRQLNAVIQKILMSDAESASLETSSGPDPVLSDPLAQWHDLLERDPEVNLNVLLEQATHELSRSNALIVGFGQEANRLTNSLRRAAGKAKNSGGGITAILKRRMDATSEAANALKAYAQQLHDGIENINSHFDASISLLQRSIDIILMHVPAESSAFPALLSSIQSSRKSFESLSKTSITTGAKIVEQLAHLPLINIQAKKIAALQGDLSMFLDHAVGLLASVEATIETAIERKQP